MVDEVIGEKLVKQGEVPTSLDFFRVSADNAFAA
jgi:hypothetical protein